MPGIIKILDKWLNNVSKGQETLVTQSDLEEVIKLYNDWTELKNKSNHELPPDMFKSINYMYNMDTKEYTIDSKNMKKIDRRLKDRFDLKEKNKQLKEKINKAIEYINNYDVFKEYSFPTMKRYIENNIKSSIKYEFDTSIKKYLLSILDLNNKDKNEDSKN